MVPSGVCTRNINSNKTAGGAAEGEDGATSFYGSGDSWEKQQPPPILETQESSTRAGGAQKCHKI